MTTPIVTERLKQRFARWDHNGDGSLQRSDFVAEARRVSETFGADPESSKAKAMVAAMSGNFEFHADRAGVSLDGQISQEQFLENAEQLILHEGEAAFSRMLYPIVKAVVGLADRDDDGVLSKQEFVQWLQGMGTTEADAVSAFDRIDADNNGELSVDEVLAAFCDFHSGKLDAPIFG